MVPRTRPRTISTDLDGLVEALSAGYRAAEAAAGSSAEAQRWRDRIVEIWDMRECLGDNYFQAVALKQYFENELAALRFPPPNWTAQCESWCRTRTTGPGEQDDRAAHPGSNGLTSERP